MKIILLYIEDKWVSQKYSFYNTVDAPLGLGFIRAYALKDSFIAANCEFVNKVYPDGAISVIVSGVLKENPDIVCFSAFHLPLFKILEICKALKLKNEKLKIIIGGHLVPISKDENLSLLASHPSIDILIRKEGEVAFSLILKYFLGKTKSLRNVPNISYRKKNILLYNKNEYCVNDLNTIPSAYLGNYIIINNSASGLCCLETSRGCLFSCSFCAYCNNKKMRFFDLDRLESELILLKERQFKGTVHFVDPLINADEKRMLAIIAIIKKYNFKYEFELVPELMSDRILNSITHVMRLKCSFGVQSVNEETLRQIGRRNNFKKIKNVFLQLSRCKNIETDMELIIGLPGDNYESFKKSLNFMISCNPGNISVADLLLLSNSFLFPSKDEFGIKYDPNRNNLVLSTNSFSEEDMVRSSHLVAVLRYLFPSYKSILYYLMKRKRLSATEILERLVLCLNNEGKLDKKKRIIILSDVDQIDIPEKTFFKFLQLFSLEKKIIRLLFRLYCEIKLKKTKNKA